MDAPLAPATPGFTRLAADADMLDGLCGSLRFGPLTRSEIRQAAVLQALDMLIEAVDA